MTILISPTTNFCIDSMPNCYCRWLRRHIVPRHSGGVRPGQQHMEQRHSTHVGALWTRVCRVLSTRDSSLRSRRTNTHSHQKARQATFRIRILGFWDIFRPKHIQKRWHTYCQQHYRNPIESQNAQRLHVVNINNHRQRWYFSNFRKGHILAAISMTLSNTIPHYKA